MSDTVYRCRSCKTRVNLAMPLCPICGEVISAQTVLQSVAPAKQITQQASAVKPITQPEKAAPPKPVIKISEAAPSQTKPLLPVAALPTPTPTPTISVPTTQPQQLLEFLNGTEAPSAMAAALSAAPVQVKKSIIGRSFGIYVACVVMVLVGSFLIGLGLARRYTASEQAAQAAASAPGKVIVVQPAPGVGGPLNTDNAGGQK